MYQGNKKFRYQNDLHYFIVPFRQELLKILTPIMTAMLTEQDQESTAITPVVEGKTDEFEVDNYTSNLVPASFRIHLRSAQISLNPIASITVDICNTAKNKLMIVNLRRTELVLLLVSARFQWLQKMNQSKKRQGGRHKLARKYEKQIKKWAPEQPGVYGLLFALEGDTRLMYQEWVSNEKTPLIRQVFNKSYLPELKWCCNGCGAFATSGCLTPDCEARFCSVTCQEVRRDQHRVGVCHL